MATVPVASSFNPATQRWHRERRGDNAFGELIQIGNPTKRPSRFPATRLRTSRLPCRGTWHHDATSLPAWSRPAAVRSRSFNGSLELSVSDSETAATGASAFRLSLDRGGSQHGICAEHAGGPVAVGYISVSSSADMFEISATVEARIIKSGRSERHAFGDAKTMRPATWRHVRPRASRSPKTV